MARLKTFPGFKLRTDQTSSEKILGQFLKLSLKKSCFSHAEFSHYKYLKYIAFGHCKY